MSTYRNSGTTSTGEQTATQSDINDAVTASAASAAAALVSENNADTSEIAAELAETNAETAQTAAELAETNAETAQTAAELAETNAETAETNASASETNAAASAVEAAASAAYTKDLTFPALADIAFPDIATSVAVSNIYEPFLESNWPLMMEDKSWYDEEGYGVDGVYHSTVTTTERDALTPAQGDVCYNSTTTQFEKYNGSAWAVTYRGNKREFPARAIAVAEAAKVIIYDLTESEPVMWMVFIVGTYRYLDFTSTISSVEISGGKMFVGCDIGLAGIDFINDKSLFSRLKTASSFRVVTGISERNEAVSAQRITDSSLIGIVNSAVNDIATTQPDNAPIDEYGVKGVTWAVATDGGVSVGRTDGNVWDITDTANGGIYNTVTTVSIDNTHILWSGDSRMFHRQLIPNADETVNGFTQAYLSDGTTFYAADTGAMLKGNNESIITDNYIITAGVDGLTLSIPDNEGKPLVNRLTSNSQSSWLSKDIKGAWLADNDDTNVTGSELVTNGDFATDSDWTKGTGYTISGGVLVATNVNDTNAEQVITVTAGKPYLISFDVVTRTDGQFRLKVLDDAVTTVVADAEANTGTFFGMYTPTTSSITIQVNGRFGTSGADGTIDNVSAKLADSDRSVNNNGLQVNGTITKTRLGGDDSLVAYSGFSASNYLEQPYNADLDFGTGDFYIMGWLNPSSYTTNNTILQKRDVGGGNQISLYTPATTGYISIVIGVTTSSSTTALPLGVYSHVCVHRLNGILYFFIDGKLVYSASNNGTATNTSAYMTLGANYLHTANIFEGSLALLRIGAGAPSAEDIEFIYKQEKPLIVNGADAVLGGASDAITAIAWDDYKNQLKVQSADYLTTIQGSTVIKKEASTSTLVTVSDGEEVTL